MNLVALYKTWDGGEFVDASLASIYDHVSAIVMVHSDVSWLGEEENTVYTPACEWCREHDHAGKVHHVTCRETYQERQYQIGIDYIRQAGLPCDIVMVVDADEVWHPDHLERAIQQIHDKPFAAYRCNMHTYLKTPFFQVDPPFGSPTTFLREPKYLTQSPRGCGAPAVQLDNVWMYHFTGVRASRSDVERKIRQSRLADKAGERIVPDWMTKVYDRLPEGRNLHYFQKHRHVWACIKKITTCDMPPAMRAAKLLPLWLPDGHLLDGERNAIDRLAKGRERAVDLGTFKGLSAVTLALACKEVHTFDCYDDLPADSFADTLNPNRYREELNGHSLENSQALAARYGNITAYKARSVQAAAEWRKGLVDVLFVDDDHSEASVLNNVAAWRQHLRRGAVILCHDNNDIHPGVQSAVLKLGSQPWFRAVDPGEFSGSLFAFEVLK